MNEFYFCPYFFFCWSPLQNVFTRWFLCIPPPIMLCSFFSIQISTSHPFFPPTPDKNIVRSLCTLFMVRFQLFENEKKSVRRLMRLIDINIIKVLLSIYQKYLYIVGVALYEIKKLVWCVYVYECVWIRKK